MTDSTAQVVIVGAGILGASIAYHLAARGCTDVLILERAETEITGSTARSAAGIRHQFPIDNPATWAEYQRSAAMQRRLGVHVEVLTPDEAARFVPQTRTDGLLGAT